MAVFKDKNKSGFWNGVKSWISGLEFGGGIVGTSDNGQAQGREGDGSNQKQDWNLLGSTFSQAVRANGGVRLFPRPAFKDIYTGPWSLKHYAEAWESFINHIETGDAVGEAYNEVLTNTKHKPILNNRTSEETEKQQEKASSEVNNNIDLDENLILREHISGKEGAVGKPVIYRYTYKDGSTKLIQETFYRSKYNPNGYLNCKEIKTR